MDPTSGENEDVGFNSCAIGKSKNSSLSRGDGGTTYVDKIALINKVVDEFIVRMR
jgi:hypothetical protein